MQVTTIPEVRSDSSGGWRTNSRLRLQDFQKAVNFFDPNISEQELRGLQLQSSPVPEIVNAFDPNISSATSLLKLDVPREQLPSALRNVDMSDGDEQREIEEKDNPKEEWYYDNFVQRLQRNLHERSGQAT